MKFAAALALALMGSLSLAQSKDVTTFFQAHKADKGVRLDPVIVKRRTLHTFGKCLFSFELDGFAGINAGQGSAGAAGAALSKQIGVATLGLGFMIQVHSRPTAGLLLGVTRSY